ncbi:tyrosine-type recombinase/integrase [Xanthobacter agilis]|uniref:tyrosine-type recombinase/integrase n=1 Tax=Xanthobacter agilis TaxID=47492 RepID=UPI00372B50D2
MARITKRVVDAAAPRADKWFTWDSEIPGFGLVVMPSGTKSYVLRYRTAEGRDRRMALGRAGVLTPDQARAMAREALVKVTSGADPLAERRDRRAGATMNDLFDRYIAEYLPLLAARTSGERRRLIDKHLRPEVGLLTVEGFGVQDARRLHFAMRRTPIQANAAIEALSKAMALAEEWGLRPEGINPCSRVKKYPANARDRFLSYDEIVRLGAALEEAETTGLPWDVDEGMANAKHLVKPENRRTPVDPAAVAVVRLLLLTGARLSEITELQWPHVDFHRGTLALPYQKGRARRAHPVAASALDVLARWRRVEGVPWVFPSASDANRAITVSVMQNAWQRIRHRAGLDDVHLHDLRHTFGTAASRSGGNAFQIRDVLRHSGIAMSARYVNPDADPMRALTETVGESLSAALAGRTGEVVPLKDWRKRE